METRSRRRISVAAAAALLVMIGLAGGAPAPEKLTYGFEMNGTLVGYVEITVSRGSGPAQGLRVIEDRIFAKLTLLGQAFDLDAHLVYRVDPASGRLRSYDGDIRQGGSQMGSTVEVEGDTARFTSKAGGEPRTVALPPDVVFDDSLHLPHLVADLGPGGASEKDYPMLDVTTGEVHRTTCTYKGKERLELPGGSLDCRVFEMLDRRTGQRSTIWVDPSTTRFVKTTLSGGVTVELADPTVVGKIKRAELDDTLFARVKTAIADFRSLTSMKVRAAIRTVGEIVTPESLNVPGQRFTGTVEDNRIEGVFEIEPRPFDGKGAPPFPPPPLPASADETLRRSLAPEPQIESQDSGVASLAREQTRGAADSWDAARRLGDWVARNIRYEIPGGSARHTLETRAGECGSHARLLAALCRSVGIPARLATGCMYVPNFGGSFGQHAWTEVHMGGAGWIPVDSTVGEIERLDAGHIRLGTRASFQPEKMEVLDYRRGGTPRATPGSIGTLERVPWKVGETYTYRYTYAGTPLGTDSFTVEGRTKGEAGTVYEVSTRLDLKGRTTAGRWSMDERGRPLRYRVEGKAGSVAYTIDCDFRAGKVVEKASQGGQPLERTVTLPERAFLLDNNNFSLFAFLLPALAMEPGRSYTLKTFHPTSMQLLPVEITVGGEREEIVYAGGKVECARATLMFAGTALDLWVDASGRILRETEGGGRLVVELLPPGE